MAEEGVLHNFLLRMMIGQQKRFHDVREDEIKNNGPEESSESLHVKQQTTQRSSSMQSIHSFAHRGASILIERDSERQALCEKIEVRGGLRRRGQEERRGKVIYGNSWKFT